MDSNSTPCKPGLSAAVKARAYLRNELLIGETLYADILDEAVKVHKAHTAMKHCFPHPGMFIIRSVSNSRAERGPGSQPEEEKCAALSQLHIHAIKRLCHAPRL